LHEVLEQLPAHLWSDVRRKRGYVNQVLARGEIGSAYRPARRLWTRTQHGYYLPNPAMSVRLRDDWQPAYEAFALAWTEAGTVDENAFDGTPSQWLRSGATASGAEQAEQGKVPG
jgi:hypothetical protein